MMGIVGSRWKDIPTQKTLLYSDVHVGRHSESGLS